MCFQRIKQWRRMPIMSISWQQTLDWLRWQASTLLGEGNLGWGQQLRTLQPGRSYGTSWQNRLVLPTELAALHQPTAVQCNIWQDCCVCCYAIFSGKHSCGVQWHVGSLAWGQLCDWSRIILHVTQQSHWHWHHYDNARTPIPVFSTLLVNDSNVRIQLFTILHHWLETCMHKEA